jgi:hypothetical protein
VLRQWLKLSRTGQIEPYLYPKSPPSFHPKVIIVEGTKRFAIVGSGNLSAGGLKDNVECSVYITNPPLIDELIVWFAGEVDQCEALFKSDIDEYEPRYERAKKARKKIETEQQNAENKIVAKSNSRLRTWNEAIGRAREYFASNSFRRHDRARWVKSARRIHKVLHIPQFKFSKKEWKEFFTIEELGDIVPIYSDQLFTHRKRLQKALRYLVNESIPIHERVNALMNHRGLFHLHGLGINGITKILCAHRPAKWPVLNGPVRDVLQDYGYDEPSGAEIGEKYEAFSRLMNEFRKETGANDMVAIDSFFYNEDQS